MIEISPERLEAADAEHDLEPGEAPNHVEYDSGAAIALSVARLKLVEKLSVDEADSQSSNLSPGKPAA